jgi:hypothetical protein
MRLSLFVFNALLWPGVAGFNSAARSPSYR